jgi:hypothetical protein
MLKNNKTDCITIMERIDESNEINILFLYVCMLFSFIFFIQNEKYSKNFSKIIDTIIYNNFYLSEYISESDSDTETDVEKVEKIENINYEDKYLKEVSKMTTQLTKEEEETYEMMIDTSTREEVMNCILGKRHKRLNTCFVMDMTPVGNVVMYYNTEKETFEYYSDHTVPYRFLETLCRKYVMTYKCTELYIDMQEQLKEYGEKLERYEEKKEEEKKEEEKKEEEKKEIKKNVFANFKSYNKEAGSGRVNNAPFPKNYTTNVPNTDKEKKIILKEKSNHYTCVGRFSNFSILKKIEKKDMNKNYSMTFAEFKKHKI